MMGRTHEKFGSACALLCYPAPLLSVPIAYFFATWPDLDQKQSTASRRLPPLGWFVRLWAGGHRRRTHLLCATGRSKGSFSVACATAYVALVAGLVAVWPPLGWGFAIGYTSHLLGDWIFNGNRRWGPKTDGFTERNLGPFMALMCVAGVVLRVLAYAAYI